MSKGTDFGPRRALRIGVLALPIALLAGCVKETTDGSNSTFRYELWVPLAVFFGGVAAAPLGWAIRRRIRRIGWIMVLGGPFLSIFVAPCVFCDQVSLGRDGFWVQTGFWGMETHQVKYDQIQAFKVLQETRSTRSGPRTDTFYLFEMKAGVPVKIGVNDDLTRTAAPLILARVTARGIPVEGESAR